MNTEPQAIDVAYTSETGAIVPAKQEMLAAPAGLFGSDDPEVVIQKAVAVANALKKLVVAQGFAKKLKDKDGRETEKEHVFIEGWQVLGGMLDAFPQTDWSRPIENGYEARVIVVRRGQVIGAGEAVCLRSEYNWRNRPDYALKSMAITRAAGKAFRLALGFVMAIAGYSPTPAEEMLDAEAANAAAVNPPSSEPKPESHAHKAKDDKRRERIFALIGDYAALAPEAAKVLQDDDTRHSIYQKLFRKHRLADLTPQQVDTLARMIKQRIDEASTDLQRP